MLICLDCGEVLPAGTTACPQCGKEPSQFHRVCTNCEIPVLDGDSACSECGGNDFEEVGEDDLEFVEDEGAAPEREEAPLDDPEDEPITIVDPSAIPFEDDPVEPPAPAPDEPAPEPPAPAPDSDAGGLDLEPRHEGMQFFDAIPPADGPPPDLPVDAPPAAPAGDPPAGDAPPDGGADDEKARKRAARLERMKDKDKDKDKDKGSGRKKGESRKVVVPQKPPKSVRLEQRRLPVLVGAFLTLFVSLYFAGDFVLSVLTKPMHFLQLGLFLWGAVSFLFLLGHGRWGRAGAWSLSIIGAGAAVYFMIRFKQENFVFLIAMGLYLLALAVTTTGKGWFLRTAVGLLLFPLVVATLAASVVLDFGPSYLVNKPGVEAVQESARLQGEAGSDQVKILEALKPMEDALEQDKKVLEYFDTIPWDRLGSAQYVVYSILGRKRVLELFNMPLILCMLLHRDSPHWLVKEKEELVLHADPVTLLEDGVFPDREQVMVRTEEGAECVSGLDFTVEFGGRFGKTRIQRVNGSVNIPEGAKVLVTYKHLNHARFAHIESGVTFSARILKLMTGGAGLAQGGEAICARYCKQAGGSYVLEDKTFGYELLKNILTAEIYYLDGMTERAVKDIQRALDADPRDEAAVKAAAEQAWKVFRRLENDTDGDTAPDDGLFLFLGWMVERLDGGERGDRSARKIIGREFNMVFFNAALLLNAIHDTIEDPFGEEGVKVLDQALRQSYEGWKSVTQKDEPTEGDVRNQIELIISRLNPRQKFEETRWREVLRLMARLNEKKRKMDEATGQGPQKEKVEQLDWLEDPDNALGITQWKAEIQGITFGGFTIPVKFELIDRENIMMGKVLPTFRGLKLTREGFECEVYCHEAPLGGLRLVLHELKILGPDGTVKKSFDQPETPIWDIKEDQYVSMKWVCEMDTLGFSPNDKENPGMRIVVAVRLLKIE